MAIPYKAARRCRSGKYQADDTRQALASNTSYLPRHLRARAPIAPKRHVEIEVGKRQIATMGLSSVILTFRKSGTPMPLSMELSEQVRILANAARVSLEGGTTASIRELKSLDNAIRRHRVGPLLHCGIELGRVEAEHDANVVLARHFLSNVARYERNAQAMRDLTNALRAGDIPFLILKGWPLARMLYPEPAWRHCGDLDVMVPPEHLQRSVVTLQRAGYSTDDPILSLPPLLLRFGLRTIRDVSLLHEATRQRLDLHTRPVFSKNISALLLDADTSLHPRHMADSTVPPVPAHGPALALYLLQHGIVSGWSRLKWLVDVFLIVKALDAAEQRAVADLAERTRTAAAVKASLLLAWKVFGEFRLGPLEQWIAETGRTPEVLGRAGTYAAWLSRPSNAARNPMNGRWTGLTRTLSLFDELGEKASTLICGGLASGIRIAAQAMRAHKE